MLAVRIAAVVTTVTDVAATSVLIVNLVLFLEVAFALVVVTAVFVIVEIIFFIVDGT